MHLYVNVPFSKNNVSLIKDKYGKNYFQIYYGLLINEMRFLSYASCETIYVGGFSPNIISILDLVKLTSFLAKFKKQNAEFSIELNPEYIIDGQVEALIANKVNRFSLKLESADDRIRRHLDTKISYSDVIKILEMFKKNKVRNVSVDLTFDLPGQTIYSLKNDIDLLFDFKIPHISSYERGKCTKSSLLNERLFLFVQDYLLEKGYERYEICNFSVNSSFFCQHSLAYWKTRDWVGVGFGSNSYVSGVFCTNKGRWNSYESRIEKFNLEELYFTSLMMGLRMTRGVSLGEKKFLDAFRFYQKKILKHDNFIITNSKNLKLKNINLLDDSLTYLL